MKRQNFDRNWRFHLGDPPEARWWKNPDTSSWRVLDLPHDWSVEQEREPDAPSWASGGYFQMGRSWYRKAFEVPEDWEGKKVFIEFEGVYMNAEVWLNQNYLGRHPYGYTTFAYDLTPYLKAGEENTLTVKVDNDCQLNSRWYSGSGIYRHVWLMVTDPVHVGHWGVYVTTPEVSEDQATVNVETTLNNETETPQEVALNTHLVTPEGDVVETVTASLDLEPESSKVVMQVATVDDPQLWSPEAPNLYRIETEVLVDGEVVDTNSTPFGIRTLAFSAEKGFLLNGQETLLKGGCVHHDNGVMGTAAYDRSEARKVERLKANGYNAIRCAHNPPSPAFLDACDRLGMLVIDEAFDCWREGKTPYDYHVAFPDWWQRDLDSMLFRDRNHPSVIMWSIGNEVRERNGRSQGVEIAQALADRIREVDPTRPVTAAINGSGDTWPWEQTDAVFAALDVGGYNYQEKQYRSDHERHPERIMYGSESTAEEALEHWTAVEELPYVIGDFVWTSLDYLGEAGIGRVYYEDEMTQFLGEYPWHQANCGDLDLCYFKRPQSYYRDILWHRGDQLTIEVHQPHPEDQTPKTSYWGWPLVSPNWTWPGREGETFQVDVYSACDEVELRLNGESLGTRPTGREERFIASFEVPYEAGTLTAVGFEDGERVAEAELETVDEAESIRLTPDREALEATFGDLAFITVEVVDGAGRVDPNADHTVFFTVQGPGSIAAVGSGNPVSEESYRGHQRKAFQGRCLVVVKTDGTPGTLRLRAQADGLDEAEITFQVKN
jgi:beta-galactosidase